MRQPAQRPGILRPPMPVDHYENFPVASVLLPARLRAPVEAIYAFARSADDIADEGDAPPIFRLARLNDYRRALHAIEQGTPFDDPTLAPIFDRLGRNIREFKLPVGLFRDLLDAFSQDVGKTRYADFAELSDYCRRSANPVGRLLLCLYGAATPDNLRMSDRICTSLQLINHWQDVAIDAHGAEFVDQHRQPLALRVQHQMPDQRGLAGPQKAGDDGDGGLGQVGHMLPNRRNARDAALAENGDAVAPWHDAVIGQVVGDRPRQGLVARRIDAVGAGADHGDRRAATGEGAAMRGGVDAQRQSADDGQAGAGQDGGEGFGGGFALLGGIAAADDRQRRPVEQFEAALDESQYRRIGGIEQRLRIGGVGKGDDVVARPGRPFERGVDLALAVVGQQPLGEGGADHGAQGAGAGGKNRFRQAEGLEQPAPAFAADAGNQRQAQPVAQRDVDGHALGTQGVRTVSPG